MDTPHASDGSFNFQYGDSALQAKLYQSAFPEAPNSPVLVMAKSETAQSSPNAFLPAVEIIGDSTSAKATLEGKLFILPAVNLDDLSAAKKSAQDERARFEHEKKRQAQDSIRRADEEILSKFDETVGKKVDLALASFEQSLKKAASNGSEYAAVYDIPDRPVLSGDRFSPANRRRMTTVNSWNGEDYGNAPRRIASRSESLYGIDLAMPALRSSEKQLVETLAANGWETKVLVRANGTEAICVKLP